MPLPTTRKGESKADFISRFMSSAKEYGQKQRLAIAYSQWRRRGKLEHKARSHGPPRV